MRGVDRTEFQFGIFEVMRVASPVAGALLAFLLLIAAANYARAAECLPSADADALASGLVTSCS
jgi:hypothetical protein